MCVFIFAGDHPQPDISYFVFCIYTKVIFLKVNKPMLSMALQNISDLFTAVWVSATIPTRTRQWGYTHLGDTREEQKVQSCLRQHLGCVPSCRPVLQPHWSLPSTLHCSRASSWCCRKPQDENCHFQVQIYLLCSHSGQQKSRLKSRNKEALLCPQFSISLIHP